DPKTGPDIWVLPDVSDRSAPRKPFPFARTSFVESQGQLSPDGRWMAYTSDESGQYEVYVRPFPSGLGRWQVSTSGGREPRWRRGDGRELFYLEGNLQFRVMAVPVTFASTTLAFGLPRSLFELRTVLILPPFNMFGYTPSVDGRRFLLHRVA